MHTQTAGDESTHAYNSSSVCTADIYTTDVRTARCTKQGHTQQRKEEHATQLNDQQHARLPWVFN